MREPSLFFKFLSFERKDVLEKGLIRFAPLGSFNDPFELEPSITPYSRKFLDLSESELRNINIDTEDYKYSSERVEQVSNFKDEYRKKISKFGVLSLSTNKDINPIISVSMPDKKDPRTNILMWSHYADSHRGFVIEFGKDFIEGVELRKVEYSNERDYLAFEDIQNNSFDNIFYKKSPEWIYEQEYRAVLPLKDAKVVKDNLFHLFSINKESIKSITFGCAMSEDNKKIIMNMIKNDNDFNHVTFNHARLHDEQYYLDFYHDDGQWSNNPDSCFAIKSIPTQKKL
jgi:hypothetical protein